MLEGVVVGKKVSPQPRQFLSPIFLRPKKKPGEFRMILNLKKLNGYFLYEHFKMENFENALELVSKDMYFGSVDIKHAYYSIPIAEEQQQYFRFLWNNKIFQYTCMPNGISPGPRYYTKLMKPVYARLRSDGHVSTGFIDDSLLGGSTKEKCLENIHATSSLMTSLGFLLNLDKSVLVPTQVITYLGHVIDAHKMIVYLPADKKKKIEDECRKLFLCKMATIRTVAHVIGLIVSCFSAVELGKLHYRELEKGKSLALKENRGNFDAYMRISLLMKSELKWWVDNIHSQYRKIRRGNPTVEMCVDSSRLGWGSKFGDEKIGGHWTEEEQTYHINALEMLAILFSLRAFKKVLHGQFVKILYDSATAVSYVNNFRGIKSSQCNEISKKIWEVCTDMDCWLLCAHIPGRENIEADSASRNFNDNIEWSLDCDVYKDVCLRFGQPSIDLFASRLNRKVEQFCSWKPDPCCTYVDAFSICWGIFDLCYLFCPFSLIGRCIQKIKTDQADCWAILPLWPTQHWWPIMLETLVENPLILPKKKKLLKLVHTDSHHPLEKHLVLVACKLSGHHSKVKDFQNQLPVCSWHHGENQRSANMKCIFEDGYHSVINKKLINFQFL